MGATQGCGVSWSPGQQLPESEAELPAPKGASLLPCGRTCPPHTPATALRLTVRFPSAPAGPLTGRRRPQAPGRDRSVRLQGRCAAHEAGADGRVRWMAEGPARVPPAQAQTCRSGWTDAGEWAHSANAPSPGGLSAPRPRAGPFPSRARLPRGWAGLEDRPSLRRHMLPPGPQDPVSAF